MHTHMHTLFQIWHRVHTSHLSNIFSAKFLPWSSDLQVVSCAGVGTVEHTQLSPDGEYVGHQFHCHTSLTYQVLLVLTFYLHVCRKNVVA